MNANNYFVLLISMSASTACSIAVRRAEPRTPAAVKVTNDENQAMLRKKFEEAKPVGEPNRKDFKSGEAWTCISDADGIQYILSNNNLAAWRPEMKRNPSFVFDVSCSQNSVRASSRELGIVESGFREDGEFFVRRPNAEHIYLRLTAEGLMIGEFTKASRAGSPRQSLADPAVDVQNYFFCVPEGQLAAPMRKIPGQEIDTQSRDCAPIS